MKKCLAGILCLLVVAIAGIWVYMFYIGDRGEWGQDAAPPQQTAGNGNSQTQTSGAADTPEDTVDPIRKQLENMSLREKVGQMMVAGLDGYALQQQGQALISQYHVGGVILFKSNVKDADQLVQLINDVKEANQLNPVPIFVSVDQEGGRVNRMPSSIASLPSNAVIGKAEDGTISYEIGRTLGFQLNAFGFNMNFAPVLDINSNPKNPVIGDRSFGGDAKLVAGLGVETMKGLQEQGIIPVVKHFPGHGDTSVDSHTSLPVVKHEMDRLEQLELVPFRQAIGQGADAVMVAHILLPALDPTYPASLSPAVVDELLRKKMQFDGVVVTDDLTMGAITNSYTIGEAAVLAVKAGADLMLVCHGYQRAIEGMEALEQAVQSGEIPVKRIDESVKRILQLKRKYNLQDVKKDEVNVNEINQVIQDTLQLLPDRAEK